MLTSPHRTQVNTAQAGGVPLQQSGFTMIEVLVALLIIVLGLLGLAGLQARIQQAEFESYQRSQALVLLYDMVARVNVNRATASCFAFTNTTSGTPYLGTAGTGYGGVAACGFSTVVNNANADASITEWDNLLQGAAETKGGASVGAMVGARGCVSYDAASELLGATGTALGGTGIYTVIVAWQGTIETAVPPAALDCANGLYGDEKQRRVVATTFRAANLN